jgi:5-methylcytosine-specific restriction endonuclease McrA
MPAALCRCRGTDSYARADDAAHFSVRLTKKALPSGRCLFCTLRLRRELRIGYLEAVQGDIDGSSMRTLVLNAGFEPLAVVSFKRALVLVMNEKATVIAHDAEHPVLGLSHSYERPSVILLTRYVRIPNSRLIPVSRRGVLRRDDSRCAYCGGHATTIDHVLPRSRGGDDSWENLVSCCLKCNNLKSDRTPREMGWSLRYRPQPPHGTTWLVRGVERTQPQWEEYLAPAA